MTQNANVFLFKNNENVPYAYFPVLNTFFEVTDSIKAFVNGSADKEVKSEFNRLVKQAKAESASYNDLQMYGMGDRQIVEARKYLEGREDFRGKVIIDLGHGDMPEREGAWAFLGHLKERRIGVTVRKQLSSGEQQGAPQPVGVAQGTAVTFKSDYDTLKRHVAQQRPLPEVVELDLQTAQQLEELFLEDIVPLSTKLILTAHGNASLARKIIEKLTAAILALNIDHHTSRIVNLRPMSIVGQGRALPQGDIVTIGGTRIVKASSCGLCKACWAKPVCWNARLYNFFAPNPALAASASKDNCATIRELVKDLLVMHSNNHPFFRMQDKAKRGPSLPITFTYKELPVKVLNP